MPLVLLIVGRQLLTVLDNQALNRRLAAMVGELEHQAFHDGLTGLPNRALFRERVALARRRRSQAGTPLALLFIDLDDFRRSTTSWATPPATTSLADVAGRLKTCVRGEDTVARLGGDELAILLEQSSSHEAAVRVAGRILEAMRPPFALQGRQVQVRGQRRRDRERRQRGRRRPPRGRRGHVHGQGPRQGPLRAGLQLSLGGSDSHARGAAIPQPRRP